MFADINLYTLTDLSSQIDLN